MNQHMNVYSAIYNNQRETIKVFFESADIGDFNYQNLIWVIDEQNNKMLVRRADLVGIRFEIGGCEETTELKNKIKSTMQIVEERLKFNEAQKSLPGVFWLHTWLIRVFKKEEDLHEYLDYILATKAKRETFTHQKTQDYPHENFWYPDFLAFKASGLTLDKFDKTATIKPHWREYVNPRDYFADCYKLKKNGDLPQNYNIDPPFNAIYMWGIRSDELEKIRVEEQEKIFN